MRKVIGLIAGGFKPLTAGHYLLIENASKECDLVHLFVSMKGRERPGEFSISWSAMEQVWNQFLEKALPKNVKVTYSAAPIGNVMGLLTKANTDQTDNNTYIFYSDRTDIEKNFLQRGPLTIIDRLLENNQIIFKSFERKGDTNISGTKMRKFLENGDVKSFIEGLPKPVRLYGPEIFKILRGE